MGDTGNSGGAQTHLHFEVHPVSMLFLGKDGAVDPGAYLASWRHLASLAVPGRCRLGAEGARHDQAPRRPGPC